MKYCTCKDYIPVSKGKCTCCYLPAKPWKGNTEKKKEDAKSDLAHIRSIIADQNFELYGDYYSH